MSKESRPGQIYCNDFYCCISISLFYILLRLNRKIKALAALIFKIISYNLYVCLKAGSE